MVRAIIPVTFSLKAELKRAFFKRPVPTEMVWNSAVRLGPAVPRELKVVGFCTLILMDPTEMQGPLPGKCSFGGLEAKWCACKSKMSTFLLSILFIKV